MSQQLTQKCATAVDGVRMLAEKASWPRLPLAAVLILSAFLNLFRLTSVGYRNTYYAAAVKHMLTSWHNFFFVSFDAGFVTVDKPPLGLWIQAASAELLGLHGWSILLPQAVAGVLSVALLYHLVRRVFGPAAGILAALVLAVTPVAVAVERTNNADALLALTMLVGAWAVIRAVERGRLRWLLTGVAVVGLGFNIKMLEAFLVLPAFYLLYLVAAPMSWWRRFVHLGLATMVLLVVSLSWAVVVELTPTDQRPYVGSSSNNSELDLIVGYNGFGRVRGRGYVTELITQLINGNGETTEGPGGGSQSVQQSSGPQEGFGSSNGPGARGEIGQPGPLQLLDEQHAGQIGWLLPLALVGLLAASCQRWPRIPLDREYQALVLWGTWLLTMVAFFSFAGRYNAYYMVVLTPAIAALVGAGGVALWSDYRSRGWRGWLLPLSLLSMAALHTYIILAYYDEDWTRWLLPAIVGLCLIGVLGLACMRLRPRLKQSVYFSAGAVAISILVLLIAPIVWATYTAWQDGGRRATLNGSVEAGPQTVHVSSWGRPDGEHPGGPSDSSDTADPALMAYLQANRGDAKYLVATTNARSASPIILTTNEPDPVITLGGFDGHDPVLSADQLANLVDKGAVHSFLIQNGEPDEPQNEAVDWVQDNCQQVPQGLWQSSSTTNQTEDPRERAPLLYECGSGGRHPTHT